MAKTVTVGGVTFGGDGKVTTKDPITGKTKYVGGGGGGSSGGQSTVSSDDLQKRINEMSASIELKRQQQEAAEKAKEAERKQKEKESFSKLNEQQKLAYLRQREQQRVAQERIIKTGSVVEKYREMLPKGQSLAYYQQEMIAEGVKPSDIDKYMGAKSQYYKSTGRQLGADIKEVESQKLEQQKITTTPMGEQVVVVSQNKMFKYPKQVNPYTRSTYMGDVTFQKNTKTGFEPVVKFLSGEYEWQKKFTSEMQNIKTPSWLKSTETFLESKKGNKLPYGLQEQSEYIQNPSNIEIETGKKFNVWLAPFWLNAKVAETKTYQAGVEKFKVKFPNANKYLSQPAPAWIKSIIASSTLGFFEPAISSGSYGEVVLTKKKRQLLSLDNQIPAVDKEVLIENAVTKIAYQNSAEMNREIIRSALNKFKGEPAKLKELKKLFDTALGESQSSTMWKDVLAQEGYNVYTKTPSVTGGTIKQYEITSQQPKTLSQQLMETKISNVNLNGQNILDIDLTGQGQIYGSSQASGQLNVNWFGTKTQQQQKTSQVQQTKQLEGLKQINLLKFAQPTKQTSAQAQPQPQKTGQATAIGLLSGLKFRTPKPRPQYKQPTYPKPRKPTKPRPKDFLPKWLMPEPSKKVKQKYGIATTGYEVQLRRGGEYAPISKELLPYGEALKLGVEKTTTTLGQTFRLVPKGTTTKEDISFAVPNIFTTPKRRTAKLEFVERRGQTLKKGTGEVSAILKSRKGKRGKKLSFF